MLWLLFPSLAGSRTSVSPWSTQFLLLHKCLILLLASTHACTCTNFLCPTNSLSADSQLSAPGGVPMALLMHTHTHTHTHIHTHMHTHPHRHTYMHTPAQPLSVLPLPPRLGRHTTASSTGRAAAAPHRQLLSHRQHKAELLGRGSAGVAGARNERPDGR
jgi:hypothetical protein